MADITISLYNNTSKNIVVDKQLSSAGSVTGTFRTTVDELRPTFIVQGTVAANVNYAYIPTFNRYYYVTDVKKVTKDLTELSLYTDVLKSFSTELYAATGVVQRNKQNYDMYLNDNKIPTAARKTVAVRRFGRVFPSTSSPAVIMLVLGG